MGNTRYLYLYKILSKIGATLNGVVIDCSCGEGYGASLLQQKDMKIIGYDISAEEVKKSIDKGVEAYIGDIRDLSCEDSKADIFICSETLEHLTRKESLRAIQEINRVCKDGAYICVTVPEDKVKCLNNKKHKQFISVDDLRDLFISFEEIFKGLFRKSKGKCNLVMIFRKKGDDEKI